MQNLKASFGTNSYSLDSHSRKGKFFDTVYCENLSTDSTGFFKKLTIYCYTFYSSVLNVSHPQMQIYGCMEKPSCNMFPPVLELPTSSGN